MRVEGYNNNNNRGVRNIPGTRGPRKGGSHHVFCVLAGEEKEIQKMCVWEKGYRNPFGVPANPVVPLDPKDR